MHSQSLIQSVFSSSAISGSRKSTFHKARRPVKIKKMKQPSTR